MPAANQEMAESHKYFCTVSITRIRAAFDHILRMRNLSDLTGINQILFVKPSLMQRFQEALRVISFSDDMYESLYDFVHNHRYDGISIVTPEQIPISRLWDNFDFFCAAVTSFSSYVKNDKKVGHGQVAWASRGHDHILMYINNPESTRYEKKAMFLHDCFVFTNTVEINCEKPKGYKRKKKIVEIEYGDFYLCPGCGGLVCGALISLRELWKLVR